MTVEEFSDRVREFNSAVQTEFPVINARIARSALSLIRDRIINEGIDHTGKPFGKYSTNPLPLFFFTGKELGSGAEKRVKAQAKANLKQGINGVSYEQFRAANNLQTNHIDFKFSGDMWRDVDVLETTVEGNVISTIVASKNSITRQNGASQISTGQIMEYLAERFGDFLALSEKEIAVCNDILNDELQILSDSIFER